MNNRPGARTLLAYASLRDEKVEHYSDLRNYGINLVEETDKGYTRKDEISEEQFWTLKKIVDQHLDAQK